MPFQVCVRNGVSNFCAFVKDCHFLYYSLITPEGRDLWRDFWRSGAEELKAHGKGRAARTFPSRPAPRFSSVSSCASPTCRATDAPE